MRTLGIAVVLALSGCRSGPPPQPYTQSPFDAARAPQLIEQLVMEQHPKFRPSDVNVTIDYLEVIRGDIAESKQVPFKPAVRTTSKTEVTRIYFDSISVARMIPWRRYFIAEMINTGRTSSLRVFIRPRERAVQFMDAVNSLRDAKHLAANSDTDSKCLSKGGTMANGLCVVNLD